LLRFIPMFLITARATVGSFRVVAWWPVVSAFEAETATY